MQPLVRLQLCDLWHNLTSSAAFACSVPADGVKSRPGEAGSRCQDTFLRPWIAAWPGSEPLSENLSSSLSLVSWIQKNPRPRAILPWQKSRPSQNGEEGVGNLWVQPVNCVRVCLVFCGTLKRILGDPGMWLHLTENPWAGLTSKKGLGQPLGHLISAVCPCLPTSFLLTPYVPCPPCTRPGDILGPSWRFYPSEPWHGSDWSDPGLRQAGCPWLPSGQSPHGTFSPFSHPQASRRSRCCRKTSRCCRATSSSWPSVLCT